MGERTDRARARAEAARQRAEQASAQAHELMERIPAGQPIITGRGSRTTADINRRERLWNKVGKAAELASEAQYRESRARRVEHQERRLEAAQASPSIEGVGPGDEVIACFTNCGRDYRFRGRILARTVNYWKVETLGPDAPYGEAPGRVFRIPVLGQPRSSTRNRVYRLAEDPR